MKSYIVEMIIVVRKIIFVFFVFLIMSCNFLFSQQVHIIDSLNNLLETKSYQNHEEQLDIIDYLCEKYMEYDLNKAMSIANDLLKLSQQYKIKKFEATAYESIGTIYYLQGKNDSSLYFFSKGLHIREKDEHNSDYFNTQNNIANILRVVGKYDSAILLYNKVLKYYELSDNKVNQGQALANIGAVYFSLNNLKRAKEYTLRAWTMQKESNDSEGLAISLFNLMQIAFKQKNYTEAIYYGEKTSLLIKTQNYQYYAYTLLTLGSCYHKINNKKKAIQNIQKAIKIYKENNNIVGLMESYVSLSEYFIELKQYKDAKQYGLSALQIADTSNREAMQSIFYVLKVASINLKEPEDALHYSSEQIRLIEERINEKWVEKIADADAKYQLEKKEKEVFKLKNEKEKRNKLINALLVILILVISMSILYYRNKRQKQIITEQENEIQRQKISELEKDQRIIATQGVLEGETSERKRISRDLHDGLGGMLSIMKLKIAHMKGNLTIPEEFVVVLNSTLEILDNSMKELRRIVHNLMPESLIKYGLNAALTDFCNSLDIVEYHYYGTEQRFNDKLEVAIYRIVNELVNNSLKHSGSEKIHVQFFQEPSRISLIVNDNGKGFDLSKVDETKSKGLHSIRSRVSSFNGNIDIITSPGKGTEVSINFNLN